MPASLVAVAVLLVLFVPGYLFQAGVKEHHSVLATERDLYAVAQAVAISSGGLIVLLFGLRILGSAGFPGADSLHDELLHDPASEDGWSLTTAQEILLICLLIFPVGLGRLFGRWKTWSDAKNPGQKGSMPGLFFAASPTHTRIYALADAAEHSRVFVRIVRQGQEDMIGLLDRSGASATKSPLGQGLALTARWAPDDRGRWSQLPGAHVGTTGIVEIQQWNEGVGALPIWLSEVPELEKFKTGH